VAIHRSVSSLRRQSLSAAVIAARSAAPMLA
jgi:hypothetical protein